MSEAKNQSNQLATILGEGGRSMLVGTRTVFVGPIKAKQLSGILSCLTELNGVDFTDYFGLLTTHSDIAIRLIAEALAPEPNPARRPNQVAEYVDIVGSLDLLEIARIAGFWWEINKYFFVENQMAFLEAFGIPAELADSIRQTLSGVWGDLVELSKSEIKKGDGPTSSSSSSPTDITSVTSANTP